MTTIELSAKDQCKHLLLSKDDAELIKAESTGAQLVSLSQRQLCDLEMLLSGAFCPLKGFMDETTYNAVLSNSRLPDGGLWTMPVTLDVSQDMVDSIQIGETVGLCDSEGFMLATLEISSIWEIDKNAEAEIIYGTDDQGHPGVRYLFTEVKDYYIGGIVKGLQLPIHFDFEALRSTPDELRAKFHKLGWNKVIAYHTSKPMHRVQYEITLRAAKEYGANILIHPVAGVGKPGDLAYYSRVHCYQALLKYYPQYLATLSLIPIATRMAGPREAVHNMIIRQNYGCTHYIVGPEHAAPPGVRAGSKRFYERYSSQKLIEECQGELGIKMIPIEEMAYSSKRKSYFSLSQLDENEPTIDYDERKLNNALEHDEIVPEWYSFPEVLSELSRVKLSRKRKGFTLFFTGLSGSGKSTLAKLVYAKFIEQGGRPVTLLDGDVVRTHLSKELGFSKEHRDINVKRIGFVASEITKNRGIAICAPIAPYRDVRRQVRVMVEENGAFIEIHVATPLEECEKRDRKGLYDKARRGIVKNFTGISDPYDIPENPEIRIDTSNTTPTECAQEIMLYLFREGYLDC